MIGKQEYEKAKLIVETYDKQAVKIPKAILKPNYNIEHLEYALPDDIDDSLTGLCAIIEFCDGMIKDVIAKGYSKDHEMYTFEFLMKKIYGDGIFDWWNANQVGSGANH
ncbi:unnamed protein product [marine sediment metagenome]|uniref:Uncharacterized protein n=1 Tax=marine sediment metagenome TaxID=412755 RepID=X0XEN8_9ZZZZ